jgi:heme oxygenase
MLPFEDDFHRAGMDLRGRLKTHMLQVDFEKLGYTSARISQLPQCQELPDLSDMSRMLGCLYVLEGSTLGGQLLLRHFRDTLNLSPDTGASFYEPYGSETGKMWKAFVKFLDQYGEQHADLSSTIAAASETFECLEHWLIPS